MLTANDVLHTTGFENLSVAAAQEIADSLNAQQAAVVARNVAGLPNPNNVNVTSNGPGSVSASITPGPQNNLGPNPVGSQGALYGPSLPIGMTTFPSDLQISMPSMSFYFSSYNMPSINSTPKTITGPGIRLPIPANLLSDLSVSYNDGAQLGPVVGAVAQGANAASYTTLGGALNLIENNGPAAAGAFGSAFGASTISTLISNLTDKFKLSGAAQLAGVNQGSIMNGISAVTGLAVNPYLTVLFQNPNFRHFNFSWRFIPNSPQESMILKSILMIFQSSMLPSLNSSTSGALYNYPMIVNISMNPSLINFKQCVVRDCRINYAPQQVPAFYSDNAPSQIELTLDIEEIALNTQNDVALNGNTI